MTCCQAAKGPGSNSEEKKLKILHLELYARKWLRICKAVRVWQ